MGLFCIVFGVVVFLASLAAGHVVAILINMNGFLNVLSGTAPFVFSDLLTLPASEQLGSYLICLGIFAFLGLLMGLGLFMNGLIYRRLGRVHRSIHRMRRHHHHSGESEE